MSKKSDYEKRTIQLAKPVLEELGLYIYDVEYVKEAGDYYLRLYIDKDDGVSIDDCVEVSRRLNDVLDEEDFIADAYTFEVSSPGIERVLKKDWHFKKALGSDITVKLYKAIDREKELTGRLIETDDDKIKLEIKEKEIVINKSEIALARMAFK